MTSSSSSTSVGSWCGPGAIAPGSAGPVVSKSVNAGVRVFLYGYHR
ncbi:hypothetical protein ACFFV7_47470 [Nonomuraea spiralis]|uniref:Uncharacterized protein n=1 Tax=Nonomuraea spiralis TaxID=46182 RepID=A0ABV5IWF1_9ACTN|nr:hypothetical protein [Nonomuraea spiralis]